MAQSERDDPYKAFNFRVEIDGVTLAAFSEVSGLEIETEVIEYRTGTESNTVRKLPGLTKHANIVLRRGVTQDAELWNWRKTVEDGQVRDRRWTSGARLTRRSSTCKVGMCRSCACSVAWTSSDLGDGCVPCSIPYPATSGGRRLRAPSSPSNTSGRDSRGARRQ